jgi:hypothetical protein
MKKELQDKLFQEFPTIFQFTAGKCENDDGWYDLIYTCCKMLQESKLDVKFTQIKEKFGTLRMYFSDFTVYPKSYYRKAKLVKFLNKYLLKIHYKLMLPWPKTLAENIVMTYEVLSSTTCEHCGKAGITYNKHGWLVTSCEECNNLKNALDFLVTTQTIELSGTEDKNVIKN